jgi:FMN phosphatase YigB (HAD superfamily)
MINATVNQSQFEAIRAYLQQQEIELLISDFNGVLDDYYTQKYAFLSEVLGPDNQEYLAALAVFTDTEYMVNRSATLEQSVEKFFANHGIAYTDATRAVLSRGGVKSFITAEAREFLAQLNVPFVIYTSQNAEVMAESLNGLQVDLYSRDRTGREKPSVQNLEMILNDYNVTPERVCVLGDGLIDDLMPARLMGMKTVLISPFADDLHMVGQISK